MFTDNRSCWSCSQIIVNKESEGDMWKTIKSEVKLLHINTSQMLRVSHTYNGVFPLPDSYSETYSETHSDANGCNNNM